MTGLEEAALQVGNAVMRQIAVSWLAERKARHRRGADLTELISLRFAGLRQRSRNDLRRKLEEVGDSAGEQLQELCRREFPELADGDRVAALRAVVEALRAADLSDAVLFGQDLDPLAVARDIRTQVRTAPYRADLGEAGAVLFDRALDQACMQVVYLVRELPEFESRTVEELLRRSTSVLAGLEELLDRLPNGGIDGSGEDQDERFRRQYTDRVARHYGAQEIIGLSVRNFRPRTTLSVAYLSLTVHKDRPVRASETSQRPQQTPNQRVRVEPALSNANRHLIRGEAGSGKTTLLCWLAVTAVRGQFSGPLADWNGRTPFLIKLRSFAGKPLPRPDQFLDEPNMPVIAPMPSGWAHRQLESGRALLLVDGLDELAEKERPKVRDWLGAMLIAYPDVRMVVTARPMSAAPQWLSAEGFESLSLQRMSREDIDRMVVNWHEALLAAADRSQFFPFERRDVEQHGRRLLSHLRTHAHLRNLARNPLMCTMLCALHLDRGGHLPRDRNGLYEAALEMLLHRRDAEREIPSALEVPLDPVEKRVLLQAIAWWLSLEDRSEIDHDLALEHVGRSIERMPNTTVSPETALAHLLERSGVIRNPAEGKVDFVHRTFQEYLSAREAAEAGHVNLLVERSRYDQWTEIIIMASSLLNRKLRAELIGKILEYRPSHAEHRRRTMILAVACREVASDLPPDLLAKLRETMRRLVPPETAEQAAELAALGERLLDYLPASLENLPIDRASPCIVAAALVGGDRALTLLETYAKDERPQVRPILLSAWRFFDTEQYVDLVLNEIDFTGATVVIDEPKHMAYVHRLGDIQSCVADLQGHELTDLSALQGASLLHEVRLNMHGTVDLAPLREHRQLTQLDIRNAARFENLEVLRGLPHLYRLFFYNSEPIPDISFLAGIPNLEGLSLGKLTEVEDYTPLRRLLQLRWLELRSCERLTSLDDIKHFDKLTQLALTDCPGGDLTTAIGRYFPLLRKLVLNRTRTTDITPLCDLPLEELWLDNAPVRNLAPLQDHETLRYLHLHGCTRIETLEPLTRLPALEFVDLSRAASDVDLSPLEALRRVTIRLSSGQDTRNGRKLRPRYSRIEYV